MASSLVDRDFSSGDFLKVASPSPTRYGEARDEEYADLFGYPGLA
jgi:hypothetical protein